MKTTFIYALKELAPGEFQSSTIRYVGKADDPYKRFEQHLRCREKSHLGNWIRGLPATGGSLQLEVLDEVPDSQWTFWEREYIRVFRAIGFKLVNGTAGGEGGAPMTGKRHSLQTRKRMSEARIGVPHTLAHRLATGAAQKGVPKSQKQRVANRLRIRRNNSSGIVGVSWYPANQKWGARVPKPGAGREFLGLFDSKEQAGTARAEAMRRYYGS